MVIYDDMVQGSKEWHLLRCGLPTASMASKLVTSAGKASTSITDYAYTLATEKFVGQPVDAWEGNEHTDRGSLLENDARIACEQKQGYWVEQIGFATSDDSNYGCSPDGLVDEDGMIELKCPMGKNIVKNWMYYDKHNKAMPDYIPQIQMAMFVCEREWADLCFYHNQLPLLVIRQKADKEFHKVLKEQIAKCLEIRDSALVIIERSEYAKND